MSSVQPLCQAGTSVETPSRDRSARPGARSREAYRAPDRGRSMAEPRSREAFGQVLDRERVAVLDRGMRRVEPIEEDVRDADLLELASERLGTQVKEELVALAGVDVDRLERVEVLPELVERALVVVAERAHRLAEVRQVAHLEERVAGVGRQAAEDVGPQHRVDHR